MKIKRREVSLNPGVVSSALAVWIEAEGLHRGGGGTVLLSGIRSAGRNTAPPAASPRINRARERHSGECVVDP